MSSTLSQIRALLEDQIDSGETSEATDPEKSLLNAYINQAIIEIAMEMKPREFLSASPPTSINIVSGQNSAAMPATILSPDSLYVLDSQGKAHEVYPKDLNDLVETEGPASFFDSSNTGNPTFYAIRGSSIIFNKHFDYSYESGIKLYGVFYPTTLALDIDTSPLPTLYDLLIVYKAAVFFYQKDDDFQNQEKFRALSIEKRDFIVNATQVNYQKVVRLDNKVFNYSNRDRFGG